MAGNKKHMCMRISRKNLIISSLLSIPITTAVYFWFLQPPNFISKWYIVAAILIWVVLIVGIYYFLLRIKHKIASINRRILYSTLFFCLITASLIGIFVIGLENTPYNLFTLPKHSIIIENASENENDVLEMVFIHSGLSVESFSKLVMNGSWTRNENSLITQGTKKASLVYEGWLAGNPTLSFQAQPDGGRMNIYWDGQLEQVSLSSRQSYEKHVTKTFETPILNKLPVLIAGILTIAIGLLPLILLLTKAPISFIVPFCFLISYLLFFLYPVFLNSYHVMQFFSYVPIGNPIGLDLDIILRDVKHALFSQKEMVIPYPPFSYLFFTPFTILDRFTAYGIVTFVSVICYFIVTLMLPIRVSKKNSVSPLLMLILITGLFSFGFQFELERGQFNLITMCFCFLSIYIFHHHKKHRFWAYMLFTASVQLKLYPAIFIFMFIDDWRDWKGNLIRFFNLGAANFCALFILGYKKFYNYFKFMTNYTANPVYSIKNHSIKSFTSQYVGNKVLGIYFQNPNTIEIGIMVIVFICFGLILYQAYRQKYKGLNPNLLLACTLCGLLIPSTSHDYTLSFLAAPIAILFTDKIFKNKIADHNKPFFAQLLIFFSFAYVSTLFSYTNKPVPIQNNFPALILMLIILTFFSLTTNMDSSMKRNNARD